VAELHWLALNLETIVLESKLGKGGCFCDNFLALHQLVPFAAFSGFPGD